MYDCGSFSLRFRHIDQTDVVHGEHLVTEAEFALTLILALRTDSINVYIFSSNFFSNLEKKPNSASEGNRPD